MSGPGGLASHIRHHRSGKRKPPASTDTVRALRHRVADTHCQLVAAGGWLTESNVASTSVIRRSSLAILLFRLASLVRVVFSACARGGVSNAVRRDLRSALCVEVCRTGPLAQTKLVQELRERLDAKLDGLRKLSLLPVALHPGLGDERSAAARHAPSLGRRVVADPPTLEVGLRAAPSLLQK